MFRPTENTGRIWTSGADHAEAVAESEEEVALSPFLLCLSPIVQCCHFVLISLTGRDL